MTDTPAVSVVIATYNRAQLLLETIESILNQRFKDFELLIIDDGSTDQTREILKPYNDRVRYHFQENRGPSAARNLGVLHARAPWISIQDSDDICTPDHLEVLHGYVRSHPDCGMVFANGGYIGGAEHGRQTIIPAEKSRRLARDGIQWSDLFEKSIVRLQAALISKRCYETIGGHDESLRICMDLDLSFRLFAKFPVAYLDRVLFMYRKHQGNSGRNEELRLVENIRVIDKLLRDVPEAKEILGPRQVDRRIGYRYYRLAKSRYRTGRHAEGREAIRGALGCRPHALTYRLYSFWWRIAKDG
jgi:glycosyltransferase involved in cell wall biosynthesis